MRQLTTSILALFLVWANVFSCKQDSKDDLAQNVLLAALLTSTRISTAADLTTESSVNYDDNQFGLVTSTRVKSWIDNWAANKPSGITGNLVIIVFNPNGSYTRQYLKPAAGVNVFDWTSSVFSSTDRFAYRAARDNGIINDPNALPTGAITDEILQTYGIDASKDLIVFAAGHDSGLGTNASPRGSVYQNLHRGIYWLRYWGVDRKNLAVLNGAFDANGDFPASYLTTSSSELTSPTKGSFSLKSLRSVDNSVLVQPLENIISFVKNGTSHNIYGISSSVLFADARHNTTTTAAEFTGNPVTSTSGPSGAALFAGHIKGSKFTPWPVVVDQTTGKFKSKDELVSLWDDFTKFNSVNQSGDGFKTGQTIVHYCRTNARSMVTGLSAFLILGKPSVFYENSFIEWSALSANHTNTALRTLPAGHVYATDTNELTESGYNTPGPVYNNSASLSQYSVFRINQEATTTRKNLDEDRAYKFQ
ncbi:hypothetical protein LPTSP4_22070 [Leptospira ryugenii]|uniref:Rhodanese domain-containing protein n=1 Tax=Leptospira ryugenii TaxID=1917863 RepID=A0A2P2E1C4_9LEPT|nr:hypothetical protein [Leptospira ryugenii]GBF50680.1 hypothetical protein LPTSP4_22070 [Leptospira ryugenii]